jgi:hypothetical protein
MSYKCHQQKNNIKTLNLNHWSILKTPSGVKYFNDYFAQQCHKHLPMKQKDQNE